MSDVIWEKYAPDFCPQMGVNWQFQAKTPKYSVSQKKISPSKTFCDIFTCSKPVQLKIILTIARTYFYVYTNFGPFI